MRTGDKAPMAYVELVGRVMADVTEQAVEVAAE
jgi:hypothetical protein